MNDDHDDQHKKDKQDKQVGIFVLIFLLVWIVATLAAYWKAWSCTAPNLGGGSARQVANLLLVPLLGPFWWLLYYSQKGQNGYCMPL